VNDILGFLAMSSGLVAAIMVSANVGRRVTGYGFAVFLKSSLTWIAHAFPGDDQPPHHPEQRPGGNQPPRRISLADPQCAGVQDRRRTPKASDLHGYRTGPGDVSGYDLS
jgi:hypothetical protein